MSLLEQLDGARLVVVDEERQVAYVWFGGNGVNVYDGDGREVDYFTVGGEERPTVERVERAIQSVMADDED